MGKRGIDMNRITLYNVIDIRTNKFHSVARIRERDAKWFVSAEEAEV